MRATVLLVLLTAPVLAAPPEVPVVAVVEREVFDHEDCTGRTEASTTVEIRSRLDGYLDKVLFKEGSAVKKGDVLLQLDDRPQRAEVDKVQAEARRAEAGLKRSESDVARIAKLVEAKEVTREELEKATAAVEEAKAALEAARAALAAARINLEYTRITSPIDGRIGRANAAAGNVVRGADVLATIYALDPLYVYFDLDERTLLRLVRYMRERKEEKVAIGLALTGDAGYPRKGVVDLLDPSLDPKTGTLRVRAVLANPKEEVRPGQFVRVRLPLGDPRKSSVIPEEVIGHAGDRRFVLVVNGNNVLEERTVRVGVRLDGLVAVEEGLKPGDRVVRHPSRHKAGDEIKPVPAKERAAGPGAAGLGSAAERPIPDFPGTGPALVVTARYPGADAAVVEEAVAAPIREQLNGLEKVRHHVLACSIDGTMRMTLLFEKRTDLNVAQVLAQNRIALAMPVLPDAVRQQGVAVMKRGVYLGAVALVSPAGQYDRTYLANYASVWVRDELARVPGLADVSFFGDTEPGRQLQMSVDRERMAALGVTASDIAQAVRDQGLVDEVAPVRRPGVKITGRQPDPDSLKGLVVKAGKDGAVVRLADVARIEVGRGWTHTVALDGKPCAMLLVSRLLDADPKATAKALRDRLAELAKAAPEGVAIKFVDEP